MVKDLKKIKEKYKSKKQKLDLREELLNQIEDLDKLKGNNITETEKAKSTVKTKKASVKEKIKSSAPKKIENIEQKEFNELRKVEDYFSESSSAESGDNLLTEENNKKMPNKEIKKIEIKPVIFDRTEEINKFRLTLPILDIESELISYLRSSNIVMIKGSTGCGKSTQVPQMLVENGFNKVLMTQPRRLAALNISRRINHEIGKRVAGYQVRYESDIKPSDKIKLVTDGILLNELNSINITQEGDNKYDVIILDEAHERNVNLDILLPLLVKLAENDKIKLIIMSATLNLGLKSDKMVNLTVDSKLFKTRIFNTTYEDHITGTLDVLDKIFNTDSFNKNYYEDSNNPETSNILVFLPSKKDIYILMEKLRQEKNFKDILIYPLHSNLEPERQQLIFEKKDKQKIILATNIAETSLTIPGIKYVIDTGLEKIKTFNKNFYEYKTVLISKASAIQRAGRSGREQEGICIRLYNKGIYEKLYDDKRPQILSCDFDVNYLNLLRLNIKPEKFPFIDKPDLELSKNNLIKFGALDENYKITKEGNLMAKLGVPIRYARILLSEGVTSETIFCVGLSCFNYYIKPDKKYKNSNCDFISKGRTVYQKYFKGKGNKKEISDFLKFLEIFEAKKFNFSEENCKKVREFVFRGFCDQIAMRIGECYIYEEDYFYLDKKEGCEIDSEFVVFESMIKGKKNNYLRNVTGVDPDWLN